MIVDLEWLAVKANSENNTTIDAYAKQLYLQRAGDEYKKLGAALSLYFVLEQIKPECLDCRYCDFWTNLITLDDRIESINTTFPKYLLLLSWNYDTQLEKAYHRVLNKHFQFFRVKNRQHSWSNEYPLLIKLNGSADFLSESHGNALSMLYNWNTQKTVEQVVNAYHGAKDYSILSFAWEPEYPRGETNDFPTLSAAQEKLLCQHFSGAVLLFDGDDAGKKATDDCLVRLGRQMWVKAVVLPDSKQPDQLSIEEIKTLLSR